jgi:transposase
MILDPHRQGAGFSAIARRTGLDRKTVRKVMATGLEPPAYGPHQPKITQLQPFERYLRERLDIVPELTGRRLHRELAAMGYHAATSR